MKDKNTVTAELLKRRDEYFKAKKKRINALGMAALGTGLLLTALIPALKAPAPEPEPREKTQYAVVRHIPMGDPWYGTEYSSEGWYNEPVDAGFEERPAGVCVRMTFCGRDTMFNIANSADIDSLTDMISKLVPVHDNSPEPGRDAIEYVVMFSRGRRIFRLTKFSDGRYAVNDRGYFRLDDETDEKLACFVDTQAVISANTAKREYMEIGEELIVAYTTIVSP